MSVSEKARRILVKLQALSKATERDLEGELSRLCVDGDESRLEPFTICCDVPDDPYGRKLRIEQPLGGPLTIHITHGDVTGVYTETDQRD